MPSIWCTWRETWSLNSQWEALCSCISWVYWCWKGEVKIDLYFFVIYDVKKNLKIKPFLLNMYIRTKVVDSFVLQMNHQYQWSLKFCRKFKIISQLINIKAINMPDCSISFLFEEGGWSFSCLIFSLVQQMSINFFLTWFFEFLTGQSNLRVISA